MTRKHHWLGIAGLVAILAALGVACGPDDPPEIDLCAGVVCDVDYPGTTCDPTDGVCKCGTDDDRMACMSGQVCVDDPTPTCLHTDCVGKVCDRGQTCDSNDGLCKCGTSTCAGDEECVQNRCVLRNPCSGKSCAEGQVCDPVDGACKCGGELCGDDERCDDGICVADPCKGVYCGPNSVCNPDDRTCHCGSVTGAVCATGEACVLEAGEYFCSNQDVCEDVSCTGDSICDPDDGACRCGGIGESSPICREDQVCVNGACVGGNLCWDEDTRCAAGFKCDPYDGACKCGGDLCTDTQTCMALAEGAFACVAQCDPLTRASCAGAGGSCFVDTALKSSIGYCTAEGSGGNTDSCEVPHDCKSDHTCVAKVCRPICDVRNGSQGNPDCETGPSIHCVQQTGNIGVCYNLGGSP